MRVLKHPATWISLLALFFSFTGGAVAARLITGKQIRDNSLGTRDVKNRSLLARDFRAGQLPAGAPGAPGPQGPVGPRGPQGTRGASGTPGPVALRMDLTDSFSTEGERRRSWTIDGVQMSAHCFRTSTDYGMAVGVTPGAGNTTTFAFGQRVDNGVPEHFQSRAGGAGADVTLIDTSNANPYSAMGTGLLRGPSKTWSVTFHAYRDAQRCEFQATATPAATAAPSP